MATNKAAIVEYLHSRISAHKEKIRFLEAELKELLVGEKISMDSKENMIISTNIDYFTLFDLQSSQRTSSMLTLIKEIINHYPSGRDFTVRDIENAMIHIRPDFASRHTRARIAMELQKLKDDKIILLIHEGKGSEPHKYRKRGEGSEFHKYCEK